MLKRSNLRFSSLAALKGSKPGELPVQQVTKFEFVIKKNWRMPR
jgi:hypothetical protein